MVKIYKLIFKGEIVYVGKTKLSLERRKNGGYSKSVPFYKECKIELIEETEDESRERYWIEKLSEEGHPLLNIKKGNGLDYKEYAKKFKNDNPTYFKEYYLNYHKEHYEKNKEKIREKTRKYHEENKEKIRENQKKYYEENKEKMNEYAKKYNEENKERLKEYRREYYKEYRRKKKEEKTNSENNI